LAAAHGQAARKKIVAEFDTRVVMTKIKETLQRVS